MNTSPNPSPLNPPKVEKGGEYSLSFGEGWGEVKEQCFW